VTDQFPDQHKRAMSDNADPIHRACDFYVPSSIDPTRDIAALNRRLRSGGEESWPWPEFLVAFASNGCGDYFAYDTRQTPAPIVYIGPEDPPEEQLVGPDALRYKTFAEWYDSKVEQLNCSNCGSRETRFEPSKDKSSLMRVCQACGFREPAVAVDRDEI